MDPILDSASDAIYQLRTTAPGPTGSLPLEANQLRHLSSGDLSDSRKTPAWAGIPPSWVENSF
jgi:hypothetical protein